MCGIVGVFGPNAAEYDLIRALNSFKHRGPDAQFITQEYFFAAGVNRLAINDISDGIQPFLGISSSTIAVYNGEIYNHKNLRTLLQEKSKFVNREVDGAVIPALYEIYGDSYAKEIDGMFAIALYDAGERKLILSRDTAGEKPLYYCISESKVFFSSSLSAFGELLPNRLKLNPQGIWDYISFLWVPEPQTIYETVHSLLPGETKIFYLGKDPNTLREVHLPIQHLPEKMEDLSEYLMDALKRNVESCLMADVSIGTFLSGGLDSSIVTALSAKKLPDLHTFSIAFDDGLDPYHGNLNEAHFARELSLGLLTNHHELKMTSRAALKLLDDFVLLSGQPFAVSSGLGVLAISEQARELGVKVLLSGDGADELFGGYSWYLHLNEIFSRRKNGSRQESLTVTMQDVGIDINSRIESISHYSNDELLFALHYYGTEREKRSLFAEQWYEDYKLLPSSRMLSVSNGGHLNSLSVLNSDRSFYLPQEMLRKMDLFTMAKSIEGRAPLVRKELFRIAKSLKEADLFDDQQLKLILRHAARGLLPDNVIKRPKHGFNFPIDQWLRNEWNYLIHDTFSIDSELYRLGIIHRGSLKVAISMNNSSAKLNGHTLFAFIVLERFLRMNSKKIHYAD